MANIGYATLSVIPSVAGFGAALSSQVAPGMAAAGAAGGAGLLGALKKAMPVVAVTAAVGGLFAIGKVFDVMTDTIRVGTGASGAALDALTESAKNVGRNSASSFGDIGTAIAGISSRTGQTGPALEGLTRQMLLMTKLTGGDLSTNIAGVTRVFGDWSIATGEQSKAADFLFKVHQATGVSIDSLSQKVVQFGAPLRQLGFSFEESAVLLGKWEKEGVNTGTVLAGMKIGLGSLSKAGIEPVQGLKDVQAAIMGAGSAGEANLIAIKTFGQRAGPDMAAAVREGRFSLDELMGTINGSEETILGAASATSSFSGKWQKFKNNVLIAIQPIATKVFDAFGTGMQFMNDTGLPALQAFGAAFSDKVGPALESFGAFVTGSVIPSVQSFIAEFRNGEGAGGTLRTMLEGLWNNVLVPLAGFVTGTLVPAIGSIAAWISDTGVPALISFKDWVGRSKTSLSILAAFVTAVLLPVFVNMAVKAVASAVTQVGAWIATKVEAVTSAATQFAAHYRIVGGWIASAAAAVASGAQTVAIWALYGVEALKGAATTVASHARMAGAWLASKATAVASMAITVAAMVVGWAVMGVQALLGAAKIALAWLIALGPVGLVIAAVVGLGVLIAANFERIKGWIGGAWEWIKGVTETVWNAILGFFSAIPGRVGAFFTMVKDKILEVFSWTPLGLIINNWDGIMAFLGGLPGRVGDTVSGLWDGIWTSFKGSLNRIIGAWNDFKITMGGGTTPWGATWPSFTIDTPNIPLLARGALVTNPALAMLGESGHEAVLPFSRVDEFAGMVARQMAAMDFGKPDGRQAAGNTFNVYEVADANGTALAIARRLSQGA